MPKNSLNVSLKGADDIFSTEESRQEQQREQVQQIPIGELFPFKNHPFKVLDDESMQRTVESVEQYGVLSPLIARPRPEGGYEIISGHRRQHAAQLAGLDALPVMEQEISVKMTNFAAVLNDLAATFEGRNEYISNLCRYPLLILDDFGMERGTEYGLEQVYNVIDSRYRSEKPLIVTTNLSLDELNNPPDTAHKRIYDRVTEMCTPVCCSGVNFRREKAQEKMERLKKLMND